LQAECLPPAGERRSDPHRLPGHRRVAAAASRAFPHRGNSRRDEPAQARRLSAFLLLVDSGTLHGGNYATVHGALETGATKRMKSYHLTVLVIGFGLAIGILYLVRRDHLYIRQGFFWIAIAAVSLALAVWP